eukprot:5373919-Pleurochrysis_carterae.AAC.2
MKQVSTQVMKQVSMRAGDHWGGGQVANQERGRKIRRRMDNRRAGYKSKAADGGEPAVDAALRLVQEGCVGADRDDVEVARRNLRRQQRPLAEEHAQPRAGAVWKARRRCLHGVGGTSLVDTVGTLGTWSGV